jgi:hypothetical protein
MNGKRTERRKLTPPARKKTNHKFSHMRLN